MKCMRCRKEKGQLQEFPTRSRYPYRLCDECYAELALDAHERNREEQVCSVLRRTRGTHHQSFEDVCRS